MPRASLLTALVILGSIPACHDAATLAPGPEGHRDASASAASSNEARDHDAATTIVRVVGDEIRVGDAAVARARPASAPGALDDELRATYALAPLRAALDARGESGDVVVVLAPDAPLSHLRAVSTSVGGPIRMVLDPEPASASITRARIGVRLNPGPIVDDGSDRRTAITVELPDASRVSEVERIAAKSTEPLVLATPFAPCVEPPQGMRCVPGRLATAEPGDDSTAAIATFYVDPRDITAAEYDACVEAGGCRARRVASRRHPPVAPPEPSPLQVDEPRAKAYCAWAGKRLPTEDERATAGITSPALGLRCATEHPFLTRFPPHILDAPRPALALPEPPTAEELAIFTRVVDDPVQDKKICSAKVRASWHRSQLDGGRSEPTCRDPFAYLTTNEPRGYVWRGYIRDIGGAYVGIGSDQSYSYIAVARSRWAWVMDYDPRVVQNHLRLRAFVLAAPTPEKFVALFAKENQRRALAILDEAYRDDPRLGTLRWGYVATRDDLHPYFAAQRKHGRRHRSDAPGPAFGWLRDPDSYRYIRTMFEQGRISIKAGDLLMDGAMQQMGEAARELGVPVRVYYTSNAPTAWGGQITPAYRRNVLALPFDAESLVLQTTDGGGSLLQKTKWHHNVQWGRNLHERIQQPEFDNVWKLLEGRIPGDDQALTILGLPSG